MKSRLVVRDLDSIPKVIGLNLIATDIIVAS